MVLGAISESRNGSTAPARELTCRQFVETVTDFLEGALSSAERARLERHLRTCAGCRAYLAQMRRAISLVGELREKSILPGARERLLHTFKAWRRETTR